jgi:hypothetical protein
MNYPSSDITFVVINIITAVQAHLARMRCHGCVSEQLKVWRLSAHLGSCVDVFARRTSSYCLDSANMYSSVPCLLPSHFKPLVYPKHQLIALTPLQQRAFSPPQHTVCRSKALVVEEPFQAVRADRCRLYFFTQTHVLLGYC